ncbi:hypothetical protein HMI56_004989 [Coelomomyces lativittatus]|nr:hypothetical protein HMI56_004989 [Coelomomyces lativittatus]
MQSGYIDLDPTTSRQKPKKFKLSREEDSVYKELADLHFSAVTGCLQKHAKDLKIRANYFYTYKIY